MALEEGARRTLIDSPGLLHGGMGLEFQIQLIDLLRPDHIVALQHGRELEQVLANFARRPDIQTHRIPVYLVVVPRTASERRRYREEWFTSYFAGGMGAADRAQGAGVTGEGARP